MVLDVLLIILFSVLLIKSADLMINSSSKLARHLGISEYTISFLVIAIATSLPELIVGVTSALDGKSILSFGNVVGSNIADMTIIIAIPIFVGGALSTRESVKNMDLIYASFFALLPVVFLFDGLLSRTEAVILIFSYFFYTFLVLRKSTFFEAIIEKLEHVSVIRETFIFALSSSLLLILSEVIVKRVESLSMYSGIPLIFIGLTLTAVGTSLPELTFGLKAIRLKHKGEVVGNIVGSVIANSTIVLGVTALISPIEVNKFAGSTSVFFLLLVLLMFFIFSYGKKIDKVEALALCLVYVVFILVERVLIVF